MTGATAPLIPCRCRCVQRVHATAGLCCRFKALVLPAATPQLRPAVCAAPQAAAAPSAASWSCTRKSNPS